MDQQKYIVVSASVFLIVSLFHLARVLTGMEVSFGGWAAPLWLS